MYFYIRVYRVISLLLLLERSADGAESSSCSDEGTELHPILRTGSSTKFKPIPKVKANRRQKAKLFLERIKNEAKISTAVSERGNEDLSQTMQQQVYIHIK